MIDFLIMMLPRTQSTWLSVLLTTDESIVYHDYSARVASLEEILRPPRNGKRYVGVCDTMIALYCERLNDGDWARVQKIAIAGDLDKARDSLIAMNLPGDDLFKLLEAMGRVNNCIRLLAPVFDLPTCRMIHELCLPGTPFDEARCRELMDVYMAPMGKVVGIPAMANIGSHIRAIYGHEPETLVS